jgi:hypothetical protein
MKTYNNWPEFINNMFNELRVSTYNLEREHNINSATCSKIRNGKSKPSRRTIAYLETALNIQIHNEDSSALWYEKLPIKSQPEIKSETPTIPPYPSNFTSGIQVWYILDKHLDPTLVTGYIKEIKGVGFYLIHNENGLETVKHYSELYTDFKLAAKEYVNNAEIILRVKEQRIAMVKEQLAAQSAA